ncbi:hypothetical protein TheveDRAFT_1774 [Thermanaerovibrio velox DSM 12556]|uniref:Uncharacterized protein n=1 Tax=Thermanaerovibrio velox DSM 12556 TaxID=926567 RepID=H0UR55_9BACT|nr:hypothetical protein [Thermanaerovibrio velox]EHM10892.1 hypothetical protein TheveDRAFT_1774 [Thermanaerovibrio velox DSM 12556]
MGWLGRFCDFASPLAEGVDGVFGLGVNHSWVSSRHLGAAWALGGDGSAGRRWFKALPPRVPLSALMPLIGMGDSRRRALGLAAMDSLLPRPAGGIPLPDYLASRRGRGAVVLGRSELTALLRMELSVECVVVDRPSRDDEVGQWWGRLLRFGAPMLWVLPEAVSWMPWCLPPGALEGFEEVILGPEPYPPAGELYRSLGVTGWVFHRWGRDRDALSWMVRGGHLMDMDGYSLEVSFL